jgi:hypothetical protein
MGHLFRFEPKTLPPSLAGSIVGNTLVQGGSPAEWWRKQSNDFRTSFVRTMRTSMRNGEGVAQGIRRLVGGTIDGVTVPGIMKTTRAKAGALAATSMNAFTNNARVATYQQNNDVVKGTQQLSTLDNLTSDICVAYSEQAWDIETFEPLPPASLPFNGGPPRHFNCRSTLVPILKSFQELGLTSKESAGFPVGTRASMDGQVPGDTTFAQFLSGKSKRFQDKLLGPSRAQLWRDGNITLTQLVDMRGNPMTVAQLEVKAGLPISRQDPEAGFKAAQQKQAKEAAQKAAATKKAQEAARKKELEAIAEAKAKEKAAEMVATEQKLQTMIAAGELPDPLFLVIKESNLSEVAKKWLRNSVLKNLDKRKADIAKKVDNAMKFAKEGAKTTAQFDDAITALRKMKTGDKAFLQKFDFEADKARKAFINNITPIDPEDLALLKKRNFTDAQIQTFKEGGLIKNMVDQVKLANEASDDVVLILKDLNKANAGPAKILDIISASDSVLNTAGAKEAAKILKQAATKANAGRAQVMDVLKTLSATDDDIKLIADELLTINKKLGKKQLQNKAGEIRTLISLRKKEIALAGEAEGATLAQARSILRKDQLRELDDAVDMFKKDPSNYSARSIVQKVKNEVGNSPENAKIIDEYLHARLNPTSIILADGSVVNFDNAINGIVRRHFDDVDGKLLQQEVEKLIAGQSHAVEVRVKHTIFTRAGKRWDEIGAQPSFLGAEAVARKRKTLEKKGDPNDVPLGKPGSVNKMLDEYHKDLGETGMRLGGTLEATLDRQWESIRIGIDTAWRNQKSRGWDFGITKEAWDRFMSKTPIPKWAAHMVSRYTGSLYGILNVPLRAGSLDAGIIRTTHLMNKALDKFPKFKGTSYRGTRANRGWTPDYVEARYEVGKTVTERGFTSSSVSAGAGFPGEITFVYRSKGIGGRIIGPGSLHDHEREILYKAGTKFKVMKVERPNSQKITVYLEETK